MINLNVLSVLKIENPLIVIVNPPWFLILKILVLLVKIINTMIYKKMIVRAKALLISTYAIKRKYAYIAIQ